MGFYVHITADKTVVWIDKTVGFGFYIFFLDEILHSTADMTVEFGWDSTYYCSHNNTILI